MLGGSEGHSLSRAVTRKKRRLDRSTYLTVTVLDCMRACSHTHRSSSHHIFVQAVAGSVQARAGQPVLSPTERRDAATKCVQGGGAGRRIRVRELGREGEGDGVEV